MKFTKFVGVVTLLMLFCQSASAYIDYSSDKAYIQSVQSEAMRQLIYENECVKKVDELINEKLIELSQVRINTYQEFAGMDPSSIRDIVTSRKRSIANYIELLLIKREEGLVKFTEEQCIRFEEMQAEEEDSYLNIQNDVNELISEQFLYIERLSNSQICSYLYESIDINDEMMKDLMKIIDTAPSKYLNTLAKVTNEFGVHIEKIRNMHRFKCSEEDSASNGASAEDNKITTQQVESVTNTKMKSRVCPRVVNRFSSNQKMWDRVNNRIEKRFGFVCEKL